MLRAELWDGRGWRQIQDGETEAVGHTLQGRQIGRHTNKQTDTQTSRQTDKLTDRHTDRQARGIKGGHYSERERERDKEKEIERKRRGSN